MKRILIFICFLILISCQNPAPDNLEDLSNNLNNNSSTTTISTISNTTTTIITNNVNTKLNISKSFNFNTTKQVSLNVVVKDNEQSTLSGIPIEVYKDIYQIDGKLYFKNIIYRGLSNNYGILKENINIPDYITQVGIKTRFVGAGITNDAVVSIKDGKIEFVQNDSTYLNRSYLEIQSLQDNLLSQNYSVVKDSNNISYEYFGEWDSVGKPEYLDNQKTEISEELLKKINASIPETKDITKTKPEYFKNNIQTNIIIENTTDVYVTFVHEGAGWKNSLCFFTYQKNNPPQTKDDVKSLKIIFPNVSYKNKGGGLSSGDRVKIGSFSPNTVIGFALIAKGWENGEVGDGKYKFFSNSNLNPEEESLRQHVVLLDCDIDNLFLLSFEDTYRSNDKAKCDNDFNDVVFFVETSAKNSINTDGIENLSENTDKDKDSVPDTIDEYPEDSTKAYNTYYPSEEGFGTLGFEDLYPYKGDYDFNDLVVAYNFNRIRNAQNEVVEIVAKFNVKAIGAYFGNGFGFEMPITPDKVKMVEGINVNRTNSDQSSDFWYYNYRNIKLKPNNLEDDQSNAVVIVFDDSNSLKDGSYDQFVNTRIQDSYYEKETITITIKLENPISIDQLGLPPFNPFLISNGIRDSEVHLPGYKVTDKGYTYSCYQTLDGISYQNDLTDDDRWDIFKTYENMPFAINIPENWDYPLELTNIMKGYKKFKEWAESSGKLYPDWYKNNDNYIDYNYIYDKNKAKK
ncbi:MAG: hypothetical protein A2086_08390 [Spirochaetes bacterium GWD1_27_9]|nr:MAG: hypothetical protein A2Z98_13410 [Spirochaetes bacterium GWB1_27_13]OHD20917.1 MAG: hypothetical protein A2Y34_11830 [Spirochaetes bacterium GWC1_27_15]OHD39418.1 MAG: hypothetical protein A2086_08390 [Spirochaetes bacterium GWD1_27_9]